ncbi:ABC transporter permease [Cryptosporangium sp. NPDC048952]|uniref:ABC transporter permease n=1 Tax=Cryptosporangium sp. NPDC048952 TaxID=3363961 RepID=UPI0037207A12
MAAEKKRWGVNWLGLAVVVLVLVGWQVLAKAGTVEGALPAPTEIWAGLRYLSGEDGGLWPALQHTIGVVLIAWLIGAALGAVLGIVLSSNKILASWSTATVDMLRSLPVIALIPIAILLWGNGDETEIVLGAYAALWPMLINTAGGVRSVNPRLREVGRTLGLSRLRVATRVVMPAAGAAMLVGARLSLATTLVVCVVAEMLGLQSGVGNQLVLQQSGMQPARMWVYVLVTGALGLLANAGMLRAFRLLFPGVAAVAERSER